MEYLEEAAFAEANVFGKGAPNDYFAQYFEGNSFLNVVSADRYGSLK